MTNRVVVNIRLEVRLDDAQAVSDAACALFRSMETEPPGGNPLPPNLETDLNAMPGLALQSPVNPRCLEEQVSKIDGVIVERVEVLVDPHRP